MITKEQALTADIFHETLVHRADGSCYAWRRNGRTTTWKREPERFMVPVKYGLYSYGKIENHNAGDFHTEADCPRNGEQSDMLSADERALMNAIAGYGGAVATPQSVAKQLGWTWQKVSKLALTLERLHMITVTRLPKQTSYEAITSTHNTGKKVRTDG